MATPTMIRPAETWSRPAIPIGKTRKQYKSCDACRRNRRACDAADLGVRTLPGKAYHSESAPKACSSCTRSKKQCTFSWLLGRPKQDLPKNLRRSFDTWNTTRVRRSTEVHEHHVIRGSVPFDSSATASEFFAFPPNTSAAYEHPIPELYNGGLDFALLQPQVGSSQCGHGQSSPRQEQAMNGQNVGFSLNPLPTPTEYALRPDYVGLECFDSFDNNPNRYDAMNLDAFDGENVTPFHPLYPSTSPNQYNFSNAENSASLSSSFSVLGNLSNVAGTCSTSSVPITTQGQSPSSYQSNHMDHGSSSPFSSLQESISYSTNKFLISRSLLHIYHGSLEHALACWVTENNCPYERIESRASGLPPHSNFHQKAAAPSARSTVYARVCRLDDAFAPYRSPYLTKSDGVKASKALNASILAFASQWSHVREVKNPYVQGTETEDPSPMPPTTADEFEVPFERLIQQSLWYEARRSLLACVGMDFFKVVFAQMIFSMTQQPLDAKAREMIAESTDWSEDQAIGLARPHGLTTLADSIRTNSESVSFGPYYEERRRSCGLSQIEFLRSLDGPPTHLEEALRHLGSWRRRIMLGSLTKTSRTSPAQPLKTPSATEMQSFNMLFWLGVMCDTTSSTLTQRPLVITEDDCALEIDRSKHVQTMKYGETAHMWSNDFVGRPGMGNALSELWGTYLLSTQPWTRDQRRWPCTIKEAAAILQEAIPIKVLLFRRVAQMQALISARSGPREVEDLISATLLVYQHWTTTYSQFLSDCAADHENVPAKIQSWYIILAGHWHLGSLLAANCILQIDDSSLSLSLQRSLRRSSALVLELKRTSVNAISDLAQVSCSSTSQSFRGSDDFHFAFGQSALLTEPWTQVLMHALEKACSIFLAWLSCRADATDPLYEWVYQETNYSELCARASYCISALQLIGRKSDAASMTAATLEKHFILITGRRAIFPSARL